MALFGFQFVLSLIGFTVLRKIIPQFSPARRILVGLDRYIHPTNDDLREAIGADRRKKPNHGKSSMANESFDIPKNINVALETIKIRPMEALSIPYYTEYCWMLNFFIITTIVYIVAEVQSLFFPLSAAKDVNLSMVWCFVSAGYALKALTSVAAVYFRGSDNSGERNLCLCCGACCFLLTMLLFVVPEETIDLGLLRAYDSFIANSAEYLRSQNVELSAHRNPVLMFMVLSIFFGFLAGLLTFPSLLLGRIFASAQEHMSSIYRLLLYISFFLPLLAAMLWINPVAKDHLTTGDTPSLTSFQLDSLRLWIVVLLVSLRLLLVRPSLQIHLNTAEEKVLALRKEGGKINNLEFQRMIGRVYFYLCIAGIHLTAPIIFLGATTMLLKTLGGYSWLSLFGIYTGTYSTITPNQPSADADFTIGSAHQSSSSGDDFSLYLAKLSNVFTPIVHRGVWSLIVFWGLILHFLLSTLGVIYHTRFSVNK